MKLKIDKTIIWDSEIVDNESAKDVIKEQFVPILHDMRSGSITPTTFTEREILSVKHDATTPVLERLKAASEASQEIVNAESVIYAKTAEIKDVIGIAKASHDVLLVPTANIKNTGPLELNNQRLRLLCSAFSKFLDRAATQDEPVFFKDTYRHGTWESDVVRFGINIGALSIKGDVDGYNKYVITPLNNAISRFNDTAKSESTKFPADSQSQASASQISPGSSKVSKPSSPQKSSSQQKLSSFENLKPQFLLHPAEIYVLQEAINYIKSGSANTILVDIFVRNSAGLIKEDVHTIVLFQNPDGKFFVIDPNNSSLSSHIADLYNADIFAGTVFYVPKSEIRIYEGNKEQGYRDCVDIAVKIASGLQRHNGGIPLKKIIVGDRVAEIIDSESMQVIQEVTNNSKLNPNFPENIGVAKIKQASDVAIRKKASIILKILKAEQQFTDFFKQDSSAGFQDKYNVVLGNAVSGEYETCVVNLLAIAEDFV